MKQQTFLMIACGALVVLFSLLMPGPDADADDATTTGVSCTAAFGSDQDNLTYSTYSGSVVNQYGATGTYMYVLCSLTRTLANLTSEEPLPWAALVGVYDQSSNDEIRCKMVVTVFARPGTGTWIYDTNYVGSGVSHTGYKDVGGNFDLSFSQTEQDSLFVGDLQPVTLVCRLPQGSSIYAWEMVE